MLDLWTTHVTAVRVTANLSNFLRTYMGSDWPRRLDTPDEGTFWIDAVCINQNDPQEKAAQIRLMGAVYSSAARVLA